MVSIQVFWTINHFFGIYFLWWIISIHVYVINYNLFLIHQKFILAYFQIEKFNWLKNRRLTRKLWKCFHSVLPPSPFCWGKQMSQKLLPSQWGDYILGQAFIWETSNFSLTFLFLWFCGLLLRSVPNHKSSLVSKIQIKIALMTWIYEKCADKNDLFLIQYFIFIMLKLFERSRIKLIK